MSDAEGEAFTIRPIGVVRSTRREAIDDDWDNVLASIELVPGFDPIALKGLETFSHVEVLFVFDRVAEDAVCRGARHPRGNTAWPEVGIFAQRAKDRPNRLGLSVCAVLGVEGSTLRLAGLDAIDGTPVVDIKPFMEEFGARGPVSQPAWSRWLMANYFDAP